MAESSAVGAVFLRRNSARRKAGVGPPPPCSSSAASPESWAACDLLHVRGRENGSAAGTGRNCARIASRQRAGLPGRGGQLPRPQRPTALLAPDERVIRVVVERVRLSIRRRGRATSGSFRRSRPAAQPRDVRQNGAQLAPRARHLRRGAARHRHGRENGGDGAGGRRRRRSAPNERVSPPGLEQACAGLGDLATGQAGPLRPPPGRRAVKRARRRHEDVEVSRRGRRPSIPRRPWWEMARGQVDARSRRHPARRARRSWRRGTSPCPRPRGTRSRRSTPAVLDGTGPRRREPRLDKRTPTTTGVAGAAAAGEVLG